MGHIYLKQVLFKAV